MQKLSRLEAYEKGLKRYFTGEPCKRGHVAERMVSTKSCVLCKQEKERSRLPRVLTKEQELRRNELARERRKNEPERHSAYSMNWYFKNKKKANQSRVANQRKAMKESINCAIRHRASSLIRQAIKSRNFSKDSTTAKILGCSNEQFRTHIERQFKDGMSWENRSDWHLDHIIPISSATTKQEVYELNHHTNIRPLWAHENLKKSNKMEFLI